MTAHNDIPAPVPARTRADEDSIDAAIAALERSRTEEWDWHPHGQGFALMSGATPFPGPGPEWSRMRHGYNILSASQRDAFDAKGEELRAYLLAVQPMKVAALVAEVRRLRDDRARLWDALQECVGEFMDASQYKGEFLANKHGDAETAARFRALLDEMAAGYGPAEVDALRGTVTR